MSEMLMQAFLREEVTGHVRQLLLRRISECRQQQVLGKKKYEFNRFNVTIDCESELAVVEDDLDASAKGVGTWSFKEFSAALWQMDTTQDTHK